jgi:drug/metabolite transporter (DMT)-like permease
MPRRWFVSWGWVFRPVRWPGFVVVLLAAIFCVQVFLAVDRTSHSVSDTLYGVFPFFVPCLMLLYWIASKTSGAAEHERRGSP